MRAFLGLGMWRWVIGNTIPFKMSIGWDFSDEPWKSYALVKIQLTFLLSKNSNFASWWFFSHSCGIMIKTWSNDDCVLKIRCWPKILTFSPMRLIFTHRSNLLSKHVKQGLKPDMRILWSIWGTMKSTLGIRSPIFL